jgi:hypothetical protein
LLQKFNRRLPINFACKVERIPVRQADTAVRGCLADMIWIRSSVDASMRNSPGHITVLVKRAKRVPHKSRAASLTLDNPAKPGKARPYRPSTIQPPSTRLNSGFPGLFRHSSCAILVSRVERFEQLRE